MASSGEEWSPNTLAFMELAIQQVMCIPLHNKSIFGKISFWFSYFAFLTWFFSYDRQNLLWTPLKCLWGKMLISLVIVSSMLFLKYLSYLVLKNLCRFAKTCLILCFGLLL